MSEHTQTPWTYNGIHPTTVENGIVNIELDKPKDRFVIKRVFRDEQDRRVTQFLAQVLVTGDRREEAQANAAFIVKAVNNHEKMLAALQNIAEWRKVNISGEYEHGLRDIIRAITDCAAAAIECCAVGGQGQ